MKFHVFCHMTMSSQCQWIGMISMKILYQKLSPEPIDTSWRDLQNGIVFSWIRISFLSFFMFFMICHEILWFWGRTVSISKTSPPENSCPEHFNQHGNHLKRCVFSQKTLVSSLFSKWTYRFCTVTKSSPKNYSKLRGGIRRQYAWWSITWQSHTLLCNLCVAAR